MHAGHPSAIVAEPACPRMATLKSLAADLNRILRLADALVQAGRPVELGGLDRQVGLLCAQSLDLEPPGGRDMRPSLMELRHQL